jgi:hypothetical protein
MKNEHTDEFHLRIALSHLIAGGLFYGMGIEEIRQISKEVLDDYLEKWNEEVKK